MMHSSSNQNPTFLGFGSSLATPTTSCIPLSLLTNPIQSLLLLLLLPLLTSVNTPANLNLSNNADPNKSADRFCGLGVKLTPPSTWHFYWPRIVA